MYVSHIRIWLWYKNYKVWIKGKVEQSKKEWRLPLHLGAVAIEKGAFE